MIGNQQNRASSSVSSKFSNPVNLHQIVSRNFYPERTDMPLAKCPEAFPRALIHFARQLKPDFFNRRKNREFFLGRIKRMFECRNFRFFVGSQIISRHRKNVSLTFIFLQKKFAALKKSQFSTDLPIDFIAHLVQNLIFPPKNL